MTEQEEFEFRLRYEQEQAKKQPEQVKSADQPKTVADLFRGLQAEDAVRAKNTLMGALAGTTDIGTTLMRPVDALGVTGTTGAERKSDISQFFKNNADTNTLQFQGGRLGAQIAGVAGTGQLLSKGVQSVPVLAKAIPNLAPALESGGFKVAQKATTIPGKLANAAIRTGAGAAVGGASAGLIDPDYAAQGAMIGGAMPGTFKVAGEAGKAVAAGGKAISRKLMQSALKPTIKDLKSGKASTAIDTLLDYGINPNQRGVERIRGMIDDINDEVVDRIAGSKEVVYKSDVMPYLMRPLHNAMSQVSPISDLRAVAKVGQEFLDHPSLPNATFPVQAAQNLKQGTYRAIGKKYGQLGSAEVEAQKALARGLKDQISKKVPEVAALNATEKRLIDTLNVAERRALMELNKNPVGLSWLANNKAAFAAFMADRSAAFKSVAARMINQASRPPAAIAPAVENMANPLLRSGLLAIEANP